MEMLLPDKLKELWQAVQHGRLDWEKFDAEQERLLDEYKATWTEALILNGQPDLTRSLVSEIASSVGSTDIAEVERRCRAGVTDVKGEWEASVSRGDSVERFYDQSEAYIYDLMWWQTLADDNTPLAYVMALQFAEGHKCRSHLDFGAGVGSGSILFARHGFEVSLADISSTLLDFSRRRLTNRNIEAKLIDLKTTDLPREAYDFVTAMDVFEHLANPEAAVDQLCQAMKPGGFLFGRFNGEEDADRPQHIVKDFEPTFARMRDVGLVEVWRDEWLWGHQVFRKRS